MGGVFICYRRDDTAGWAGRLHADIQAGLRGVDIFRDIEDIPPGVRFDEFIAEAVGSCEVLIALIGPQWLTAQGADGTRRLDQPNDFIRTEIATGLDRNIRVIPALVGGAKLPSEAELPESIRGLALRQAYELSDSRWAADCRKLIADIRHLRLVAAVAAAILLGAVAYGAWSRSDPSISTVDSPSASASDVTVPPDAASAAPGISRITERAIASVAPASDASTTPTKLANSNATVRYVTTGGGAAGAFYFLWPGGDCWDIYRDEVKVTYGCGTGKQALGAGVYTIKNKDDIFHPFSIEVRPGFETHVALGGLFDFSWPGGDCWEIYRGEKKVTYGCGAGKQALEPGKYTIKNGSNLFIPFDVDIKPSVTTTARVGGVFEFKWAGGDCWNIYRGETKVTYGCGPGKQALEAGSYTIKIANEVFTPFDITVKTGETTVIAKGGLFKFQWPGGDCWDIYRGDKKLTYGCGTASQALQAGKYTIKPFGSPIFAPFEIQVRDGVTVTAP
jgi:hypothetical protein